MAGETVLQSTIALFLVFLFGYKFQSHMEMLRLQNPFRAILYDSRIPLCRENLFETKIYYYAKYGAIKVNDADLTFFRVTKKNVCHQTRIFSDGRRLKSINNLVSPVPLGAMPCVFFNHRTREATNISIWTIVF